jgi:hypothetical protein
VLNQAQLAEQVRLAGLGADGRQQHHLRRPCDADRPNKAANHRVEIGEAGRGVEVRRDQHEYAFGAGESLGQRVGVGDVRHGQFAAACSPGLGLGRIAHNAADLGALVQEFTCQRAADLSGDAGNGVHGNALRG